MPHCDSLNFVVDNDITLTNVITLCYYPFRFSFLEWHCKAKWRVTEMSPDVIAIVALITFILGLILGVVLVRSSK